MNWLLVSGSNPLLSYAELVSVVGDAVQKYTSDTFVIDTNGVNFDNLGGFIKSAEILMKLDTRNWKNIESNILQLIPTIIQDSVTKQHFGISVHGINNPHSVKNLAISIKKSLKSKNISSRWVQPQGKQLSSAQIYHNNLLRKGFEIIIAIRGESVILARTRWVQKIDEYSQRDYGKPCRNAKVGMLPPKLAQIMLNLATGGLQRNTEQITIYDPFCGSGTILQEALLSGKNAIGSDLSEKMISCSKKNLSWFKDNFILSGKLLDIFQCDATAIQRRLHFDAIVSEIYLGPPIKPYPSDSELRKIIEEISSLLSSFIKNITIQVDTNRIFCLAIPFWMIKGRKIMLPVVDHLKALGYNTVPIANVNPDDLIYRREDQIVGRQLLILKRI